MDAATLASRVIVWNDLRVAPGDALLSNVAAATVAYVESLPVIADRDDATAPWSASVELGAVMLASRLYRRRNSPNGLESFTADGSVAYVARHDTDIATMLRINAPVVG